MPRNRGSPGRGPLPEVVASSPCLSLSLHRGIAADTAHRCQGLRAGPNSMNPRCAVCMPPLAVEKIIPVYKRGVEEQASPSQTLSRRLRSFCPISIIYWGPSSCNVFRLQKMLYRGRERSLIRKEVAQDRKRGRAIRHCVGRHRVHEQKHAPRRQWKRVGRHRAESADSYLLFKVKKCK